MRLAFLFLLCLAGTVQAQTFELSVKNIMRGPELVGAPPQDVQFTDDGSWIFFRWKPGGRPWHEDLALYRVGSSGGAPEKLTEAEADSFGVLLADGHVSADERMRVVSHEGDLYIIDRATLATRRLTDTRAAETDPVFSREGARIYFLRDNNAFAFDVRDGALTQLTDIRTGPAPRDSSTEGQRKFLEEQQRELFEHVRREAMQRDSADRKKKEREARQTQIVYLDKGERVSEIAVGGDGRFAILRTSRTERPGRATMVPDWVTHSGFTESIEARTKVGDVQAGPGRVAVIDLNTGGARWIDVAPKRDTLATALAFAGFRGWSEDGRTALITALSADFEDQWLHALDAESGDLTLLAHETNIAWIGGPCDFWSRCSGWLPGGERVYYVSEKDGYSHVYLVDPDGKNERQITRGPWEVYRIAIAPTQDRFYLTTNEGGPAEQHFQQMTFAGRRTRVTNLPGRQDVVWSADGSRIAAVHSFANAPPELYVGDNVGDAELVRVTHSPTKEWSSYAWKAPPIITFEARDGVDVPARIYRPRDFGVQPNGAAVIFVHGAGYLQNVHNWWSDYYREYMFHHLLASRGYTVLDIDYRGSKGYGRDWRTAIYRHMGGKDLTDQVDGATYLAANEGIDPARVGIYGGSYGGFITLMALFTESEHFAAGAALRSVTDWAHYNHGYTGRILNNPQDDSVAYRRSSPIYFAEGLEDPLLILHGMVDTNVHFSDVVRLTQRLIELGKTDWELAVYPVEDHSFVEPTSWTDEYRRILELFERTLSNSRRP